MNRCRRTVRNCMLSAVVGLFASEETAHATTEMAGQYDARHLAMAGTGSALIGNAHSLFLNPAGLQGIDNWAFGATLVLLTDSVKAPFVPNQSTEASVPITPLPYLGFGYRVHERAVVGAAVYSFIGGGMGFDKVAVLGNQEFRNVAGVFEAQPGASFKILDNLSIGAGYRIEYMIQQVKVPAFGPTSPKTEADLSGVAPLGAIVGIQYKPVEPLGLAFVYRSKTSADLTGDATITLPAPNGPVKGTMKTELATPHEFKIGAALTLLDKKLVLATDAKVILYADSNKESVTTITTPAGTNRSVVPLDWNNVVAGGIGGEYTIADRVPVRAGFSMSTSATPYHTANQFAVPPTPLYEIHLGVGLKFEHWDFSLGGYGGGSSTELKNPNYPASGPVPGKYSNIAAIFALSANARF